MICVRPIHTMRCCDLRKQRNDEELAHPNWHQFDLQWRAPDELQ